MNKNIIAIILIVLAIGLYATFTRGMIDEVKTIRGINDQYTQAIQNADNLIKVRDQVLKDYNSLSAEDKSRLDKMIPDTTDNIRLVIDLNNVARLRGVSLRGIKASAVSATKSPAKTGAPVAGFTTKTDLSTPSSSNNITLTGTIPTPVLDVVSISFSVSAPYLQFIEFMRDLEGNLRIMDLNHLTMAVNDTGTYDFGVQLSTYWLRQ
jgi:Tfp pilus assembly protein PilO